MTSSYPRVVGCCKRLDLLCPDELGYVQADPNELLFQITPCTNRQG
jgi:hypothetical protein